MASESGGLSGKLKIGDDWNAITIIALSQNNPLKAIAEFVENSIDAGAKNVTIVRGKNHGDFYLKIIDDGHGIDDFRHVATHIGDSAKRELKKKGATGLQGEFGIGLLSFWTVGETLTLTSQGADGATKCLRLVKGNQGYKIEDSGTLFGHRGTELLITPILAGVRILSGEKIQNFLASELRDRIGRSGVHIRIVDHTTRRELVVEPRKFHGRLIHALPEPRCPHGEIWLELYMAEPSQGNGVGLFKQGTRVMPAISVLERFSAPPWTSNRLEGIIDASFLQLTPGTRDGVVLDDAYESFCDSLEPIEAALVELLAEQSRAEEEEASRQLLGRVTRAFREAFLHLPSEEYGWLAAKLRDSRRAPGEGGKGNGDGSGSESGSQKPMTGPESAAERGSIEGEASYGEYVPDEVEPESAQKSFFEIAGPLYKATISPSSSVIGVGGSKKLRAVARDRSGRSVEAGLGYEWRIVDGGGSLEGTDSAYAEYRAGEEPSVVSIELRVSEGEESRVATALVTVTAELLKGEGKGGSAFRRGLPGYTYRKAPGELWRSRFDADQAIIVINNAHADFIYASRQPMTKLRYITRLFAKELVLANFPESSKEELLERIVELTLYTEENLK